MAQIDPRTVLPAVRIAAGVGAFAAPQLLEPVLGLQMKDNPTATFMARLFGARDALLGIGALAAGRAGKPLWFKLGLACDAADAASGVLGFREGASRRAMAFSVATALGAVGLGVAALTAGD
jgi:hypothetical protein